jgi:hypothetical protein
VAGAFFLPALKGREAPMNLTRLAYDQHPRPPQRDLRQRRVFDSEVDLIGRVAHIYVDEDRTFRFLGVAMSRGFMVILPKEHLVPMEAVVEEDPDSITLNVARQTVESAPKFFRDPQDAPDEGLQRATREHFGLGAVPSEP